MPINPHSLDDAPHQANSFAEAPQSTVLPVALQEWLDAVQANGTLLDDNADRAQLLSAQRQRDMRAWKLRNSVWKGEVERALLDSGQWERMMKQAADHEQRQRQRQQVGFEQGLSM